MNIWKAIRGTVETLILGAIGGMIVAVQALELPAELSWLAGALVMGLTALKVLASKIDPEA